MKRSMVWLVVAGVGLFSHSCDKTTVNEAAGNGEVYFDVVADKEVAGQDIVLNHFRVMKSTANSGAPGAANIRDYFYVDIWATLSGEKKPRIAKLGPFVADADGNLYQEDAEPGSLDYNADLAAAVGTDITYEVTAKDGLISKEYDVVAETQSTVSESGARTTTKKSLLKVSEQDGAFLNVRARSYSSAAAFSRTRYQDNSDFSLKGKLGCFNLTTTAAGDTSYDAKATWFDVELGALLGDKDGTTLSSKTATDDSSASDQILWVKWSENWYVTGLNVNTHVVRMVRERSAPFYLNRELPKRVITTAAGGAPSPSGIEKMIRACSNAVEVTTGSKVFHLAGLLVGSDTSTTYSKFFRSIGSDAGTPHCAATKTVADTVALTTGYTAGTTVFAGCTGLNGTSIGLSIQGGTWNGTKSASTVATVSSGSVSGGTLVGIEHSAIVETTY